MPMPVDRDAPVSRVFPVEPNRPFPAPSPRTARRFELALVALAVALADLVAGVVVEARLRGGESVEIVGSFLRLTLGENDGGPFGLLPGAGMLFAFAALVVIIVLLVFHERAGGTMLESLAFGLLVGGALGNLVDRLARGSVLDYLDLGIGELRIPLFNVADTAISLGLLLFAAALIRTRRTGR
jgi:signal peptidase II